ncbi:S-adenosyl-L-methionine-dependent methyltransferase [Gracilaria domingensis]|nr:S-adenosyl-L-methionine-dependent methyltransferase [Gracilaria domingensis]
MVGNSSKTSVTVLTLILVVYILSIYDLGVLFPHSTPRKLASHGHKSVAAQENPRNSFISPSSVKSYFDNCGNDFYTPESLNLESPCFVPSPVGYTKPYSKPDCLWRTPRANIGNTDNKSRYVELHMSDQNWAFFEDNEIVIRSDGGTSVRNFGTNFDYVREILKWIYFSSITSQSLNPPKVMLDTGAGIGSVSAAFEDARGAAGSGFKVFSYVLPDNYLRLGSIIADRRLVSMLQSFSGKPLPFPENSFPVVHCRWCWHHLQGFDVWLNEMNRLIIPGGYFIFTFTPLRDKKLLPPKEWQEALDKQPWTCELHAKIMRFCRKEDLGQKFAQLTDADWASNSTEDFSSSILESFRMISIISDTGVDSLRVLNVDCPSTNQCFHMETILKSRNVLNTFSYDHKDALRRGIISGSMGFLHNWTNPAPFYPRTFDVLHLLCEEFLRPNWTVALKSLELHRLLVPSGLILLTRASCPYETLDIDWSAYGFKIAHQSKELLLYERVDH